MVGYEARLCVSKFKLTDCAVIAYLHVLYSNNDDRRILIKKCVYELNHELGS
jgi:hypothetical protein